MKIIYQSHVRQIAIAFILMSTIKTNLFSQIIYSEFSSPATHVTTTRVPNTLCTAVTCPTINNANNSANMGLGDHATASFPPLSVLSSVTFTIDLNGTAAANTWGGVRIRNGASLVGLSLLPSIQVQLLNSANQVVSQSTFSSLLQLSLLADPEGSSFCVGGSSGSYNKVRVQITNPVGLNLASPFEIYYAYGNATENCEDIVTPVKLSSFSVNSAINCGAQINWVSETEVNIDRYILQRSIATSNAWTNIATQIAQSDGNRQSYSFTDRSLDHGTYAYRLVSIEKSGSQVIHPLALYSSNCNRKLSQLYPTVTNDKVSVSLKSGSENAALQVIDMTGGRQKINPEGSGNLRQISVQHLAKGNYLLRITSANSVEILKFIVQ